MNMSKTFTSRLSDLNLKYLMGKLSSDGQKVKHPFWVIVEKEISDHFRSVRFMILMGIVILTCMGSLYSSLSNFSEVVKNSEDEFFFLRLFTSTDGAMPSFVVFLSFLGPLLGIGLGFDAINSEQNSGTLSRIMSQPIHRDNLINAKFLGALIVISILFFALGFLVMGFGLFFIGIPPTAEEFLRFICFTIISILYVAFWLNLAILFSVKFRQASTSALAGIGVWLFFTVFYGLIVNLIAKAKAPAQFAPPEVVIKYQVFVKNLMSIVPSQLYSDATTTLLRPSVRSLGPLTMEQMAGAIPNPIPLGQSLLLVWPQLTGLIAAAVLCFALTYHMFMRREIRSK
ncbi:MAG: ABC transporter permease [Cyclobacteriaceae bacterium]|nr:ABC transporter permease [Cyclobacteriaceae bacterium SS2]